MHYYGAQEFSDAPKWCARCEEVMDILGALNDSGTTVIMVTHDVMKSKYTQRLIMMSDGQVDHELEGDDKERYIAQFESMMNTSAA